MIGSTLGHYRVLSLLGSGGMGDVYVAEDSKLGRKVALKVLPADLAHDPERRGRFEREARTIAALNHPNIVTIYAVEAHESVLFLTMELIDGDTLATLVRRGGMPLAEFLAIAIPLASAVAAAHQRGITHRDLKPANVMVTRDGIVKVLDFGLAKLHEPATRTGETVSMVHPLTEEGRILGTFAYMSPEQAQGLEVDARSDIFSLGIVFYEMLAGQRPFTGNTNVLLLSAILTATPVPLGERRADLPRDVGRIIKRCLAKDRDERFQAAKDLRTELTLVRDEAGVIAQPVEPAPSRRGFATAAAILMTVVLLALAGWWYARGHRDPSDAFGTFDMRRLTATGNASLAALSEDARYAVHVMTTGNASSLWMRQVSAESSVQIVPPAAGRYVGVTFSPDGESILYVFNRPRSFSTLYRVPTLGGTPHQVIQDIDSAPAFSPDGSRFAFQVGLEDGTQQLMIANSDGSARRMLKATKPPDTYTQAGLAWSPDGARIAVFKGRMPARPSRLVEVDVNGGAEREIGSAHFDFTGRVAWLRDGKALVFDAIETGGPQGRSAVWIASYPDGAVRKLTTDLANYYSVDAAKDGRTLIAVQQDFQANLWVGPAGVTARQITDVKYGRPGYVGIDWTPDGRIVYTAMPAGQWDLWIADADGGNARQLTDDPGVEANPSVTPDGSEVVFLSRPGVGKTFEIRAVSLQGGAPRTIVANGRVQPGQLRATDRFVYFSELDEGRPGVSRVALAGGEPEPVFKDRSRLPPSFSLLGFSPDERRALGFSLDEASPRPVLAIVSMDGSAPPRILPHPTGVERPGDGRGIRWSPDGAALEYLRRTSRSTSLWRAPLDGSPPVQIASSATDDIMNWAWSRDGRTLALTRGSQSSDLVLITSKKTK